MTSRFSTSVMIKSILLSEVYVNDMSLESVAEGLTDYKIIYLCN